MIVNVAIEGMTCAGCVRSVERVLARIPGAGRISVSLGSARIEFENGSAPIDSVREAIERAGFGVSSVHRDLGEALELPKKPHP